MIKNEYIRYITSWFNFLVILLITIPVVISYYITNLEMNSFKKEVTQIPPPSDLDIEFTTLLVEEGYNGMAYLSNFLFSSDFYIIFVIILLMGFGVHIGSVTYRNLVSGFGSIIIPKIGYKKYILSLLSAQILYVSTFISSYFITLFLFSFLIWGGYSKEVIASILPFTNGLEHFMLMIYHIFLLVVYICLIILITSLLTSIIKNSYLLQITPFLLYLIPLIFSGLFGNLLYNLDSSMYQLTWYFFSDNYLLSIYNFLATDASIQSKVLTITALPIMLVFIFLVAYTFNVKKYEKGYLL